MTIVVKKKVLTALCTLLKDPVQPFRPLTMLTSFERHLLEEGMTMNGALGDYLICSERRGCNAIERLFNDLLDPLGIPKQWIYHSPEFPEDEAVGHQGLTATDAVGFLIELENLGIQVDPRKLVRELAHHLEEKRLLTGSELSVVLYEHYRRKRKLILESDLKSTETELSTTHHIDANGYQITMTWAGSDAVQLQVQGADYEEPQPQESITCSYCHHSYFTNNSVEARIHDAEHNWTQQLFDPVPDGQFAERFAANAQAELVDANSPLWMHEAVYQRARAFRREFGYDIVQWDGSVKRAASEGWHGYLFAGDTRGTIAGACGFLVEKSGEYAGQWALHWIWLAPKFRRGGILKDRWNDFLNSYGDFYIEAPLSEAMQCFVRKHGSDSQKLQLRSP